MEPFHVCKPMIDDISQFKKKKSKKLNLKVRIFFCYSCQDITVNTVYDFTKAFDVSFNEGTEENGV